jgi:hypothetical protein
MSKKEKEIDLEDVYINKDCDECGGTGLDENNSYCETCRREHAKGMALGQYIDEQMGK